MYEHVHLHACMYTCIHVHVHTLYSTLLPPHTLTFSPPQFVPLVHDWEQQLFVPVTRGQHDAVVEKLVHSVQEVLLTHCIVGHIVEMLCRKRKLQSKECMDTDKQSKSLLRRYACTCKYLKL